MRATDAPTRFTIDVVLVIRRPHACRDAGPGRRATSRTLELRLRDSNELIQQILNCLQPACKQSQRNSLRASSFGFVPSCRTRYLRPLRLLFLRPLESSQTLDSPTCKAARSACSRSDRLAPMPVKSKAQRRKFAELLVNGEISRRSSKDGTARRGAPSCQNVSIPRRRHRSARAKRSARPRPKRVGRKPQAGPRANVADDARAVVEPPWHSWAMKSRRRTPHGYRHRRPFLHQKSRACRRRWIAPRIRSTSALSLTGSM